MEHKVWLYADDLLLFVSRAETTIPYVLNLLTALWRDIKVEVEPVLCPPLILILQHFRELELHLKLTWTVLIILGLLLQGALQNICNTALKLESIYKNQKATVNWHSLIFASTIGPPIYTVSATGHITTKKKDSPVWVEMENHSDASVPLQAMLGAATSPGNKLNVNFMVKQSVKIHFQFRKHKSGDF